MGKRDYSLLGPDAQRAVETGLAAAEWYHTDVPRRDMKALMQREDGPAIRVHARNAHLVHVEQVGRQRLHKVDSRQRSTRFRIRGLPV